MGKITKTYNLPKTWCELEGIEPLLTDPQESVEGIVESGIDITLRKITMLAQKLLDNRENLSEQQIHEMLDSLSIINTTMSNIGSTGDISKLEIPINVGTVNFLESYATIHKMTIENTLIIFYMRGKKYVEEAMKLQQLNDKTHF